MGINELFAVAMPVDPRNGRARLILTGPNGTVDLPGSPVFTVAGGTVDLTYGKMNSPLALTPEGLSEGIGTFLEAGPIAGGVSTVTVTAYESGSIQTGTLICTVSGSSSGAGGYGDGLYGEGLYGVGTGTGVVTGMLSAAWSSGTIPVN